jgi:DNA-binding MarR family transcriptional regulator
MAETAQVPASGQGAARTRYPHGFAPIDNRVVTVYAEHIGAIALALYTVLSVHASHATRTCYPSLRYLSRHLKLSQPTVLKAIQVLEEVGLIAVARVRTKQGQRRVNVYTLLSIREGQQAPLPVGNNVDHRGSAALPPAADDVNDVAHRGKPALAPVLNDVEHPAKPDLAEQYVINKTQENKRESVNKGLAEPPAPTPDPQLDHPAVKAYRDTCKRTPDETQRAAIAAAVTDLARWQEIVRQWLLTGYRKQNVAGMLDWYQNGIPDKGGSHGWGGGARLGFQGNRPGEWHKSEPPETPEEKARRDAEWEVLVREAHERRKREEK